MTTYTIKRLLLLIPTLIIVSLLVFVAVRLIPGDVIDNMIFERGGTQSWEDQEGERALIEQKLGLDVPIHVQFGRWFKGMILHGDLGTSLWRDVPVTELIVQKIPVSIELGIIGIVTALVISFPIGIYSATRQDTVLDYAGRSFAIALITIPSFWMGTMVVVFPAIWLNWMPPITYIPFAEDPVGNLSQFALPGVILGMGMCGGNMRYIRTLMLEVLRQDYVRTAWAKGLTERVVVTRHALRNVLIPVVTMLGMSVPVLVGGTVILEQIFQLPGMGRLLWEAATKRDYTIVSGVGLVIAVVVVFSNLVVDLLYGYLDPRVRYR